MRLQDLLFRMRSTAVRSFRSLVGKGNRDPMAVNAYILTTKQVRARLDNYGGNIGKEPILLSSGEEGFQIDFLVLDPQPGPDVVSVEIDGAFRQVHGLRDGLCIVALSNEMWSNKIDSTFLN
jgi:hypothetical protein